MECQQNCLNGLHLTNKRNAIIEHPEERFLVARSRVA